jgi:hypothetical protein
MAPRFAGLGKGLVTCISVPWFGYQALYGQGVLRIGSIFFLVMEVVATAGAVLDYFRPRPKRRRSLEKRDAG